MKLYTAPTTIPTAEQGDNIEVFLAGSIEQGTAALWQNALAEKFTDLEVTFFNPRRETWDAGLEQSKSNAVFDEQVNWELNHLERADVIFIYFQAGTSSPISLLELGIASQLPWAHVIVVCEHGFWRRGNVEIVCERARTVLHDNLDAGISALRNFLEIHQPVK